MSRGGSKEIAALKAAEAEAQAIVNAAREGECTGARVASHPARGRCDGRRRLWPAAHVHIAADSTASMVPAQRRALERASTLLVRSSASLTPSPFSLAAPPPPPPLQSAS